MRFTFVESSLIPISRKYWSKWSRWSQATTGAEGMVEGPRPCPQSLPWISCRKFQAGKETAWNGGRAARCKEARARMPFSWSMNGHDVVAGRGRLTEGAAKDRSCEKKAAAPATTHRSQHQRSVSRLPVGIPLLNESHRRIHVGLHFKQIRLLATAEKKWFVEPSLAEHLELQRSTGGVG